MRFTTQQLHELAGACVLAGECDCSPDHACVHRVAAQALAERRRAIRIGVQLDEYDQDVQARMAAVEAERDEAIEDARRLYEALRDMVQDFAGDDDHGLRHASEREIATVARARKAMRGRSAEAVTS